MTEVARPALGDTALTVITLSPPFLFILLEFFPETVGEELRVAVAHAPVDLTEAAEVRDGELARPQGWVDVRQAQQPSGAFQALRFREQHPVGTRAVPGSSLNSSSPEAALARGAGVRGI